MIPAELQGALERAFGGRVLGGQPLAGGDINDAFRVELANAGRVFVKTQPRPPGTLFPAEAAGLAWLREANALRVPDVLAVSEPGETPAYLALEYLEPSKPARDFDDVLGRGLAALHHTAAPGFGWETDNFIGTLPQSNSPAETWPEFFRARRLEPQLQRAVQSGRASYAVRRAFDRLFAKLEDIIGPDEPPARLHGDLWAGNLHIDERGQPCLIDPAVYGGHREVDLAMMRLFGGFSERVFAAYAEAAPLNDGFAHRVALYQLYPLLVHTNLFGGSYAASVERALAKLV